jgi:hypothetical protein
LINTYELNHSLQIHVVDEVSHTANALSIDEATWHEELKSNPELFDGLVFSVLAFDPEQGTLDGFFTNYKFWITSRNNRELLELDKIQLLAVTSILTAGDSVVLGKRASEMTQDSGCWEFCPSGGIEPLCLSDDNRSINVFRQVKAELEEELEVSAALISRMTPLWLIEDLTEQTFDVCIETELSVNSEHLEKTLAQRSTREYSEFRIVRRTELDNCEWKFSRITAELIEKLRIHRVV